MKQVKIINGVYGYRPEGAKFITPAKVGECVTVSDEEAARLVALCVAAYTGEVTAQAPIPPVATLRSGEDGGGAGETLPEGGSGAEGEDGGETLDIVDGHFTSESLTAMTIANLAQLATNLGADVSKCKKKADYMDVLTAIELQTDDEEEPPVTGASGPVV